MHAVGRAHLFVQLLVILSLQLRISCFLEWAQANCATALDGVVLLRQVLPDFLMQIEQQSAVVLVLALLLRNRVELFVHLLNDFFKLLLFKAFLNDELESWRLEWISFLECDLQVRKQSVLGLVDADRWFHVQNQLDLCFCGLIWLGHDNLVVSVNALENFELLLD